MSNKTKVDSKSQPNPNRTRMQQLEQKQLTGPFDAQTIENIGAANKQLAYEDVMDRIAGVPYIKFVHHMERKVMKFTGKWKEIQTQARDFVTKKVEPDKTQTKYQIECHDLTNDSNNTELPIWERGLREILYYIGQGINVMQTVRNGQPNSKTTTYMPAVITARPGTNFFARLV